MNAPAAFLPGTEAQDRVIAAGGSRLRPWILIGSLIGVAAAAVGILLWWLPAIGPSVDSARLTFATVERGRFIREIAAEGRVVAAVSPTLYAATGGTVTLNARAGDAVALGQVLATIESTDLRAHLQQERATLENLQIDLQRAELEGQRNLSELHGVARQAEVERDTARREAERSQKAYELGVYAELQALRARDALQKAEAELERAQGSYEAQPRQNRFDVASRQALLKRQQALVSELAHQVDLLQIRSPVEGAVGVVQVADRANVAKDSPLLTVVDLSALEVRISVTESAARDLAPGMSAVLLLAGREWHGRVAGVSPEVVNGEVVARVQFEGERPTSLRQSQRVSVRVIAEQRDNVLMVDRGTFADQEGGSFAYVVQKNVAERRRIRIGAMSVGKVEILSGLAAGERIVISGTETFRGAERAVLND